MGYWIEQRDQKFFLDKENKTEALSEIKKLYGKRKGPNPGGRFIISKGGELVEVEPPHPDDLNDPGYEWVDPDYARAETLEQALTCWRWQPTSDEAGNIVAMKFTGQKMGEEAILFRKLAPFVRDGSYLEMRGEDGKVWRWIFEQEKLKNVRQRVVRKKRKIIPGVNMLSLEESAFHICVTTIDKRFASSEYLELTLRELAETSGTSLIGVLGDKGVEEIEPGDFQKWFTQGRGRYEVFLFCLKPRVECNVTWFAPDEFWAPTQSYRVQLSIFMEQGFTWEAAENLFLKTIELTKPTWGELNEIAVTRKFSFLIQSEKKPLRANPHLGSANFFGPDYIKYFGGIERFKRAGFTRCDRMDLGVYVVLPRTQREQEYLKNRTKVESRLAPLEYFDDSKIIEYLPYFHEWDEN